MDLLANYPAGYNVMPGTEYFLLKQMALNSVYNIHLLVNDFILRNYLYEKSVNYF